MEEEKREKRRNRKGKKHDFKSTGLFISFYVELCVGDPHRG